MRPKVVRIVFPFPFMISNEDLKAIPSSQIVIADNDPFWGVDLVVGRIVKVDSFFLSYSIGLET